MNTPSTIRFKDRLDRSDVLILPKGASAKLRSRGVTTVEGTINGFPFRAELAPDGEGSHRLEVDDGLRDAAGAELGDTVTIEITRVGEEQETRVPLDLRKALAAVPPAQTLWGEITPATRRDWILWISSAKQPQTRSNRIDKARDMLAAGKRRVCCFGGLKWLTKDHATCDTWLPLPTVSSKARTSPKSRR